MSGKNRRIPGSSERRPSSASGLRHLFSEAGLTTGSSLFREIFGGSQRVQPAQEWLDLLDDIAAMYPNGYRLDQRKMRDARFHVTGIYPDMITGRCTWQNQDYKVFVSGDESTPAGCNCRSSEGELPCNHSYYFVHWLMQEIENRKSEITHRINQQQFDKNQPGIGEFKPDKLEFYRRQLRHFFADLPSPEASEEEGAIFSNSARTERGRIAWDFVVTPGGVKVDCLFQSAKKKSDGWNKGRKVALNRVPEYADLLSVADQRVKDRIVYSTDYFQRGLILSAFEAAFELIGQPNVLVAGSPGTIRPVTPSLRFVEQESTCSLEFGGGSSLKFLRDDFYLEFCSETATVGIARLSKGQSECLSLVERLHPFPIALRDEMLGYSKQMQGILTVELPATSAGKLVQETATPVLLLKLAADGSLAYAWRVRLSSGQLAKTGEGPMIRSEKRDGASVQLVRSIDAECSLQSRLAGELQLPSQASSGVVSEFEMVLQLLQRIRDLETSNAPSTQTHHEASSAPAGNDAEKAGERSHSMNLEVLWDEHSEKPLRMLGSVTPQNLRVGINKSRDWFQLSGQCDFGDQQVDIATLLRSLQKLDSSSIHGNYVRLGDEGWAKISSSLRRQLQRLSDSVHDERKQIVFDASSASTVHDLLHHNIQIEATKAWTECLQRMQSAQLLNPKVPENLQAQLRDYQREGFCWMRRLAEWGVGGVLADDMGLGKTLQALAVVLDRMQEGPTLVIAPTSIGFNWVRETARFAPDLRPHLYRETDRSDLLSSLAAGDLVICSYGLALRDAENLSKIEWGTLILDEAQAIKNARSKTATAIAGIKAKWKLALTGTPVENHLGELWSVFRAVAPGVFGGWEQFRKRYAAPIERDQDEERRQALRDRLQPFILRRTKTEVLKDLPPRTESNLVVELNTDEREAYDRVRLSALGELDEIAKLGDIQDQRFKMLALLTRLRQLACSPRLVHPEWPGRSSKLQLLAETLQELRSEGHRCLVFSQFVSHLQLIREMLDEESIAYQYLDGSTTPTQRQQRVDDFQSGQADVFLISLKAGGTGLNLTAADYVIHMDPWWNPAVEDQATDRAHRIGQDKPVMVYRMISQGTIEEEILQLHESKRDLVAGVIEGSQAAAKLSTQDLMQLIRGN